MTVETGSLNHPDTSRTDKDYWEKVLKGHDLTMDRGSHVGMEEIVPAGLMGLNGEDVNEADLVKLLQDNSDSEGNS